MNVIKRDGSEMIFDPKKIFLAVRSVNNDLGESDHLSDENVRNITDASVVKIKEFDRALHVEEIQDIVEKCIMEAGNYAAAKAYVLYRYQRSLARKKNTIDDAVMALIDGMNEEMNQENSNKDPTTVSVQRDYMAGMISKDLCRRVLYPKDIIDAHDKGIIHIHDMDYVLGHLHNCELINLEDMLQNGTVISGSMIDPPKSFLTACTVATQISAQVASHTFGGQTISLAHLAPFIDVSRQKIIKQVNEELDGLSIPEDRVQEIIRNRLLKEVKAGVQTIQYQVSTIMCSNG